LYKGYRVKIYPNKEQQSKIIRFCHAARFAYNWAIAKEQENYKNGGKFISGYNLTKQFTLFKKEEDNIWLKDISGRATKTAILDAAEAYDRFFKHQSKYPKFKSRKFSKMSCATHEGTTIIEPKRIRCEKLGWMPTYKHNIPLGDNVDYCNYHLSYDGIDFWFSVSVKVPDIIQNQPKTEPIGIDLGLKTFATCSNGENFKHANSKKIQKRLRRFQKRASKQYLVLIKESMDTKIKFQKLRKSNNLRKLESKISKLRLHISNIRLNQIHNITSSLIKKNPSKIIIEDLNVSGMMKNKHLSKAVSEQGFYEFRRQLEYKCKWNGVELVIANRWYPSSKTCSCCGHIKKDLKLSDRTYICPECGLVIDRDYNAALNLKNYKTQSN